MGQASQYNNSQFFSTLLLVKGQMTPTMKGTCYLSFNITPVKLDGCNGRTLTTGMAAQSTTL